MYTVASPDPNPRGGGQLPNPNECNSTLTGVTGGFLYPNIKFGGVLPCAKSRKEGPQFSLTDSELRKQFLK